jgi:Ribbon-helix-helix protein, copG family
MMRDEREDYGEEARDVIDGLQRLARRVETPSDLAPKILARGERLLPPQKERRARWWTVVAAWRPHPLAWGPVVAVAFFIAGVFVPWPRASMPLKDTVYEKPSAPAAQLLPTKSREVSPAPPAMPSQPPKQEMRQQTEPAPAPPDPLTALARRAPSQVSSASHRQVTATLPAELYEQLQQEAQRRRVSMASILREAVEAYAQSQKRED